MQPLDSVRIAALPMYDFDAIATAHDRLWTAVAARLAAAQIIGLPLRLSRELDYVAVWRDPRLLLGQACEFPLAKQFARHVRVVATPLYSAPGCEGARYRSAVVVDRESPALHLRDLRDSRCVINAIDSNSGMNLLRAAVAPLVRDARLPGARYHGGRLHGARYHGGPFFRSVTVSGAHRRSAEMIANGEADVAALDCVTFAHLQRLYPGTMSRVRMLEWTPSSPSLPFITARSTSDAMLQELRRALEAVVADPQLVAVCGELYLVGVDVDPDPSFAEVLRLEQDAIDCGYPLLL
jgi:ABC-type phosphate/phosphonate transport system substrate-binding protein